jgi:hypothetical protein
MENEALIKVGIENGMKADPSRGRSITPAALLTAAKRLRHSSASHKPLLPTKIGWMDIVKLLG